MHHRFKSSNGVRHSDLRTSRSFLPGFPITPSRVRASSSPDFLLLGRRVLECVCVRRSGIGMYRIVFQNPFSEGGLPVASFTLAFLFDLPCAPPAS